MSNGPEHYEEAEAAIEHLSPRHMVSDADAIALAQVHATLALAAATAQNIRRNGRVEISGVGSTWAEVLQ